MLESGEGSARIGDQLRVNFAEYNPFAIGSFGYDRSPRVDQHGVAISRAPVLVSSPLRRRQNVCQILDRACTQQYLPVGAAGGRCER